MTTQDALTVKTLEVIETIHNSCAPITRYTCRCKTCGTRWAALEVFDEDGKRPSEWSWSRDDAQNTV
jgi:hypothetical protein